VAGQGLTGITRLWKALQYSLSGLGAAFRNEQAFRQEVYASVALIPIAIWLGDTRVERVLLIGSVLLVMVVEVLNSAIEAVVDRIGCERHELSGRAKDLGSAAVLLALALAVCVWGLLLSPLPT